jgi:hypothetical protein
MGNSAQAELESLNTKATRQLLSGEDQLSSSWNGAAFPCRGLRAVLDFCCARLHLPCKITCHATMIVRGRLSGFDTAADLCAGLAGLLNGVPKNPDRTQGLRDCPGHSGINRALVVQLARPESLPLGLRQGEHSFLFRNFQVCGG